MVPRPLVWSCLLLLLATPAPGPAQNAARLTVREVPCGKLLAGAHDDSFVLSPDGSRLAYVAEVGGRKKVVVVNDRTGKAYDEIGEGSLVFSPDGRHVAYLAREGGQFRRVLDEREGPSYDAMANLIFSPNGFHTAYAAARKDVGWRVIVDGDEGRFYQSIQSGFRFMPDNQRVVYSAQRPRKGRFSAVAELTYGDGDRVQNSRAHRHEHLIQRGGWRIVVGDKDQDVYERVGTPAISPDGEHVAYFALQDTGKVVLVLDGKEGKATYDGYLEDGLAYSPDGRRLAGGVRSGQRWFVVTDGKPGAEFDELREGTPFFSPDSRRLAYVGKRDGKARVVLDGTEHAYDSVIQGSWTFSPDSRRLTCIATRGEQGLVPQITSEQTQDGPGIPKVLRVQQPLFSPDGQHLAYGVLQGQAARMCLDGKAGKDYAGVTTPSFSPDSRHLVYAAQGEGGWRLVVDGAEPADRLYTGPAPEARPVWTTPTRFHLMMVRDGELFRVEAELAS